MLQRRLRLAVAVVAVWGRDGDRTLDRPLIAHRPLLCHNSSLSTTLFSCPWIPEIGTSSDGTVHAEITGPTGPQAHRPQVLLMRPTIEKRMPLIATTNPRSCRALPYPRHVRRRRHVSSHRVLTVDSHVLDPLSRHIPGLCGCFAPAAVCQHSLTPYRELDGPGVAPFHCNGDGIPQAFRRQRHQLSAPGPAAAASEPLSSPPVVLE